jgi:hypothetical protein
MCFNFVLEHGIRKVQEERGKADQVLVSAKDVNLFGGKEKLKNYHAA